MNSEKVKRMALCALLTAMALALAYIERFIPLELIVPLPGVKIGLANIVTLVALYFFGAGTAFAILIVRCLLGAMFSGTLTALLYSLVGGLLAMTVMALSKKLPFISVYGVSILGSAAHVVGQIVAACILLRSISVFLYLPMLLCTAAVTGMFTGAVSAASIKALLASGQVPKRPKKGSPIDSK